MKRLSARDYAESLADAVGHVEPAKRRQVIDNFLSLVRRQRASSLLPRIMNHLQELDDQAHGQTRVELITAMPTNDKELTAALEKVLGKVVVNSRVDADLIGGVRIRVGDRLVDGSVRSQLQTLRTHLMTSHV